MNHNVWSVEITDTFGGELNYSWLRRRTLLTPPALSRRSLVRRAKALMDWSNVPCVTAEYDGCIELRPRGMAQIMFITRQGYDAV